MALGWMTVLKMVPWGDVIENAPKVASGAKKLWQNVGKGPVPAAAAASAGAAEPSGPTALAALHAQVAELQAAVADLHQQMLESSELIQSLANQNTQLIQRVELSRKRLLWLLIWVLVSSVALASRFF